MRKEEKKEKFYKNIFAGNFYLFFGYEEFSEWKLEFDTKSRLGTNNFKV